MAQFVVLEPGDTRSLEKTVFVRDGFHTLALILPVVWLLVHRLWFEALAVLGLTLLLGFAGSLSGISSAVPLLALLFSVFVALEGANWKVAKLRRQGYVEKAVIDATDLDEAEIRYFRSFGIGSEEPATARAATPAPEWARQAPRPAYSSLGPTIGFVGHRGEN